MYTNVYLLLVNPGISAVSLPLARKHPQLFLKTIQDRNYDYMTLKNVTCYREIFKYFPSIYHISVTSQANSGCKRNRQRQIVSTAVP